MVTLPLLLVLVACAPSDSSTPGAPAADLARVRHQLAVETTRVDTSSGAPRASFPALGATARLTPDGAVVGGTHGALSLSLTSVGRGALLPLAGALPQVGAPMPGLQGPDGAASRRVEYDRGEVVEWFAGTPGGLEHGWTVDVRPGGAGPLRFGLETDATLLAVDPDAVELLDEGGGIWRYTGLAAWDATGRPLDATFVDADELLVEVDDRGAVYPIDIDPVLTPADVTLTGPSAASDFGSSLAGAGDVNADGYDDLIVGASLVSTSAGRAYVYHGSASGLSSTATSTLSGGIRTGSTPYYYCGGKVAGGHDLNGDGYDDVAVACTHNQSVVKVFLGSASGVSTTAVASLSSTSGIGYGTGLALVQSLDGDAYADVVVGAYGYASSRGRVFVYSGTASGVDTTAATLEGGVSYAMGAAIADGGDVNGDGYGDVVIGSPGYLAATGRVSVYYGSASGLSTTSATHVSGSLLSAFGIVVAGGQDVDGDGYDDIAASTYAALSTSTTEVAVLHGSAAGLSGSATTTLSGTGGFGRALAFVPDADGDGHADLLVGAPDDATASLYLGSAAGIASTASTTINEAGGSFGVSVGAADVNGDGYSDLLVGDDDDASTYGKVYVYLGYADADGDGWGGGGASADDCDDTDASVNPAATEIAGDGIDQDCDSMETCLADGDGDGYRDLVGTTVASIDADCSDSGEALSSAPATDCDDTTASVHPGATEGVADGIDADCDGGELCFDDDDGDGQLDTSGDTVASVDLDCDDAGEGSASTATDDCDDTDASVFLGAPEVVGDGVDGDCDGAELCLADADDDGYAGTGTVSSPDPTCTEAGEAVSSDPTGDCDDAASDVNPGAAELCAGVGIDEDCDGLTDDSSAIDGSVWYTDADGDGYGDAASPVTGCVAPVGAVADATDCDDTDAGVHPGATEGCADGDKNCNGLEGDADPEVVADLTWYSDADGDGFGADTSAHLACSAGPGEVGTAGDCDDGDAATNPLATEAVADGVDTDCDGGELCHADADADGYRGSGTVASADLDCADAGEADATAGSDCDDADAAVNPAAVELPGDTLDSDCDTTERCYADVDADGYTDGTEVVSGDLACDGVGELGAGAATGDCDDLDLAVNPGAAELVGDGTDSDCDGSELCYVDADDDGYLADTSTTVASVDTDCADSGEGDGGDAAGDCDDADAAFHPGASEPDCADPADYNCDGSAGYADGDGDGWAACEECDDTDAAVFPGAAEAVGAEVDGDCDGAVTCYVDGDADGYRPDDTTTVLSTDTDCGDSGEAAATLPGGDCDDADPARAPGAVEAVGDAVDSDCDGGELCYADTDNDGYRTEAVVVSDDADCTNAGEGGRADPDGDCDDSRAAYHPGAPEEDCADPADYNCDGSTGLDDHDADGWGACEECDDLHPNVNPGAVELCNGLDDDCSGEVDDAPVDGLALYADADADGFGDPASAVTACETPPGYVTDGTDCDDADSAVHPGAVDVPGDGIDQDCVGGDVADGGDTGLEGDPTVPGRRGGLYGGCDTAAGGSGLLGVLAALTIAGRRRVRGRP